MGQKVNPILFRLGNSGPNHSFWFSDSDSYSHLLSQDLEIKNFLSNLLKSNGILVRSCTIQRSYEKLIVSLDLYFSYALSKQAKFVWARALFKSIKKKYNKINRIKDIKNFAKFLGSENVTEPLQTPTKGFIHKKNYDIIAQNSLKKKKQKKYFILKRKGIFQKFSISHRNKLFYFLFVNKAKQKNFNRIEDNKIVSALKRSARSHYSSLGFVLLNFHKLKKLFVLKKFNYNFKNYNLQKYAKNTLILKDSFNLLELNKNLCKSLQCFCGLEEIKVNISSSQLHYLPSFKFYQKIICKDLLIFQKNKDLQNVFMEIVENLYFTVVSFGYGNAYILGTLLAFLLENTRNQVFVTKFLQKSLHLFFKTIKPEDIAIDGIKILIKGRFNKRRRTKKIVLQEGQISLQTISTPIDYYQTQAVTIYGSFGIKVWVSKSFIVNNINL